MGDLVAALAALEDPRKDGKVSAGQRQYRYLELTDLLAEVRAKFGRHGWAIMQPTTTSLADGTVTVVNVWLHESGERIEHPPFTLRAGHGPQDIGSIATYAKRYSLAGLVGLAGSDDDDAQSVQATIQPDLPKQVTRVKAKATDPDPWQTPPPTPPQRPAQLSTRRAAPATGGPNSQPGSATPAATKHMWTRLNKTGMTPDEIRAWVAAILDLPPEWHTADLSAFQVSAVIDRLKADTPPPEEPA